MVWIGTFIVAVLAITVYASVMEWVVHRYVYHSRTFWKRVTHLHYIHHEVNYPIQHFLERGPVYQTVQPSWLEAIYLLIHLPAIWYLAKAVPAAGLAAFLTITIYSTLVHYVHPMTHHRTGSAYQRTALFKLLTVRHVRHHQDQTRNFNTVLPIGDWLFGTLAPAHRSREGTELADAQIQSRLPVTE